MNAPACGCSRRQDHLEINEKVRERVFAQEEGEQQRKDDPGVQNLSHEGGEGQHAQTPEGEPQVVHLQQPPGYQANDTHRSRPVNTNTHTRQ